MENSRSFHLRSSESQFLEGLCSINSDWLKNLINPNGGTERAGVNFKKGSL